MRAANGWTIQNWCDSQERRSFALFISWREQSEAFIKWLVLMTHAMDEIVETKSSFVYELSLQTNNWLFYLEPQNAKLDTILFSVPQQSHSLSIWKIIRSNEVRQQTYLNLYALIYVRKTHFTQNNEQFILWWIFWNSRAIGFPCIHFTCIHLLLLYNSVEWNALKSILYFINQANGALQHLLHYIFDGNVIIETFQPYIRSIALCNWNWNNWLDSPTSQWK